MEITRYERHGVLFDSCAAMEEVGFPNGFSTRVGGVSPPPWDSLNLGASCGDQPERVAENFRRFCGAVGTDADALVKNHQVHGDLVRPVTWADVLPSPGAPGIVEADGLVTRTPGLCLTVFSADCIPVLLCDPRKKVAAAVHAGWRGTALGIAARAAEAMIRDFGCRPGDLMAAIGPGISLCCFETHGDVPAGLRAGLGGDAQAFIHPLSGTDQYPVDLKGANRRWPLRAGLSPDRIAVCSDCTACDSAAFWSHRRLGSRRGSLASVIQIR